MFDAGRLDLKPPFQRNPVWSNNQKSYLIDTMLRGYPIPELYLQETKAGEATKHIVVDGQQRVRSCLEFVEGTFTLNPKDSPEWADMTFEDLTSDQRKTILDYEFVVRRLPSSLAESEIRAIFGRLNRNVVALNAQELRHATYWGEFITAMEDLATHEFWGTAGIFTANDFRRMLDVEYVSEITIAYLHGLPNKKSGLDDWYAVYEEDFEYESDVRATFDRVLGEIDQVLPEITETRWRKKSDFYSLFLVFADKRGRLPLTKQGRETARRNLTRFGRQITEYLSEDDPHARASYHARVSRYGDAVQRAASDLANRRIRDTELKGLLRSTLE